MSVLRGRSEYGRPRAGRGDGAAPIAGKKKDFFRVKRSHKTGSASSRRRPSSATPRGPRRAPPPSLSLTPAAPKDVAV